MRRVVLEAAVARRVVDGRDDDAVGLRPVGLSARVELPRARAVVRDDRAAQRRRRHAVVELVDERVHAVRLEHLERRRLGRAREPVGVAADEQRAADALRRAVLDDRLGDRRDVGLVERAVELEPRWPLVPNTTRCSGMVTSGSRV